MSDTPVIVNVNVGQPAAMRIERKTGCLVQLLYFLFIGWWLGALAVLLAYACFALVILIPIGVSIVNHVPYLMALRQPPLVITPWGEAKVEQYNFFLRAIWFVVAGLWITAAWMVLAYLLCLTIIGMPIGFWMFDRAPALLTLHRS
jgi:uncharacterized membrane protein YccF (DUF307 family)